MLFNPPSAKTVVKHHDPNAVVGDTRASRHPVALAPLHEDDGPPQRSPGKPCPQGRVRLQLIPAKRRVAIVAQKTEEEGKAPPLVLTSAILLKALGQRSVLGLPLQEPVERNGAVDVDVGHRVFAGCEGPCGGEHLIPVWLHVDPTVLPRNGATSKRQRIASYCCQDFGGVILACRQQGEHSCMDGPCFEDTLLRVILRHSVNVYGAALVVNVIDKRGEHTQERLRRHRIQQCPGGFCPRLDVKIVVQRLARAVLGPALHLLF
eukprot:scaffold8328_cov258-Pinguiococcus_pyrenoidosus.AAC.2